MQQLQFKHPESKYHEFIQAASELVVTIESIWSSSSSFWKIRLASSFFLFDFSSLHSFAKWPNLCHPWHCILDLSFFLPPLPLLRDLNQFFWLKWFSWTVSSFSFPWESFDLAPLPYPLCLPLLFPRFPLYVFSPFTWSVYFNGSICLFW